MCGFQLILPLPNRPLGVGSMKSKLTAIPVRDANGDELTLYEFQDARYLTRVRKLKLCTGELAETVDKNTFQVIATGELLSRIHGD